MHSDWTLVTVTAVFLIGTFYLAFSPEPLNDVPENDQRELGLLRCWFAMIHRGENTAWQLSFHSATGLTSCLN